MTAICLCVLTIIQANHLSYSVNINKLACHQRILILLHIIPKFDKTRINFGLNFFLPHITVKIFATKQRKKQHKNHTLSNKWQKLEKKKYSNR